MSSLMEYLSRHKCERPNLRLIEENDGYRDFLCLTCHEYWRVTRSKIKALAREENRLDEIRRITELESKVHKVFGPYYQGASRA